MKNIFILFIFLFSFKIISSNLPCNEKVASFHQGPINLNQQTNNNAYIITGASGTDILKTHVTGSFTFEGWFYSRGNNLFAMLNCYPSFYDTGFFFTLHDSGWQSAVANIGYPPYGRRFETQWLYSLNTWNHWAIVFNVADGTFKQYANGNLISTETHPNTPMRFPTTSAPLQIGGWNEYFMLEGQLTELRFWNIAKTQAQILTLKNQRAFGNEANLVAYWPLNEGTGTTVQDKTGHGLDGAFHNTVDWESAGDLPLSCSEVICQPNEFKDGTSCVTKCPDNKYGDTTSEKRVCLDVCPPCTVIDVVERLCINTIKRYDYQHVDNYRAGDIVVAGGKAYQCKQWPYDGWCRFTAYDPEGAIGYLAWTDVTDRWFPVPCSKTTSQIADYVSGYNYQEGDLVRLNGRVYRCRQFPFYQWCSQPAYSPDNIQTGSMAWEDVTSNNYYIQNRFADKESNVSQDQEIVSKSTESKDNQNTWQKDLLIAFGVLLFVALSMNIILAIKIVKQRKNSPQNIQYALPQVNIPERIHTGMDFSTNQKL